MIRSSGQVVVSGRRHEKPWSLFLLTPREDRIIREQVQPPCPHPLHLLSLELAGSEVLATVCTKCDGIKVINLGKERRVAQRQRTTTTGTTQRVVQYEIEKVFKGKKFHQLCQGEEGTLYTEFSVEQVIEIKLSGKGFTKVASISTPKRGLHWGMFYIPSPKKVHCSEQCQ